MTSPMLTRAATRAMARTWRPGPVEEAKAFLAAQDRNALAEVVAEHLCPLVHIDWPTVAGPARTNLVADGRRVVDALLDGPSA